MHYHLKRSDATPPEKLARIATARKGQEMQTDGRTGLGLLLIGYTHLPHFEPQSDYERYRVVDEHKDLIAGLSEIYVNKNHADDFGHAQKKLSLNPTAAWKPQDRNHVALSDQCDPF